MTANEQVGQLREVRLALLHLHKTLLDYERELYERAHDRVENAYEMLRLVMHDPWFAWLHILSELVVRIDETLDAEEQPTEADVAAVMREARELVTPSESGSEFQQKYFKALQNSPDVVLAHAEAVKVIGVAKEK